MIVPFRFPMGQGSVSLLPATGYRLELQNEALAWPLPSAWIRPAV